MIRKMLYVVLIAPVALVIGFGIVSFVIAAISGDTSLLNWILNHKILLGIAATIGLIQLWNPFKK